ncbi:MAG: Flp pilus assembly protein CpaB [Bryobacterales bacterium]|nr:Flp pilus assembly protein CpaB [Bryobacterales bacterium]
MNKRFLAVVAFALVVSGVASYFIYRLVGDRLSTAARPRQASVIVAARNLQVGTLIKEGDVRLAEWSGPTPQNTVMKKEDAVERGVLATIYAGEPILESRLAQKGAGAGMAATIPLGMRAVALRVNEVAGVAGFVVPGQRVDLLIMGNPYTGTGRATGTVSKTLLQNIEVLSAGQQIQKDAEGKPITVAVVNLLVTPEQAEILSLASNEARIQLVLRNPLDTKEVKTPGSAFAQLFSGVTAVGPAAPEPRPAARRATPAPKRPATLEKGERILIPIVVEVFHGGKGGSKKTETKFKEEEKPEAKSEEK